MFTGNSLTVTFQSDRTTAYCIVHCSRILTYRVYGDLRETYGDLRETYGDLRETYGTLRASAIRGAMCLQYEAITLRETAMCCNRTGSTGQSAQRTFPQDFRNIGKSSRVPDSPRKYVYGVIVLQSATTTIDCIVHC